MSLILSLVFSSSLAVFPVEEPKDQPRPEVKTIEPGKPADCDGDKEKKVSTLTGDPKAPDAKALEDKALANLGLKKEEAKPKPNPIVPSEPKMETCK